MTTAKSSWIRNNSVWIFFVCTYGITWGLSILATDGLLPFQVPAPIRTVSSLLSHYGPALAGTIMAGVVGGKAGIGRLLGGLGRWRVGAQWYLFVLLFPTILHLIAAGMDVLLGGSWPRFFEATFVPAGNPLILIVPVFLIILLQAGLAEEIGWRGYALPALQARYSALFSSVILGVVWGLWHYNPLNYPVVSKLGGLYLLTVLPFTVLMTWVYNNTQQSLLLAVLFHTASNVSDWIIPIVPGLAETGSLRPFMIHMGLLWVAAVIVVIVFGGKRLSRRVE